MVTATLVGLGKILERMSTSQLVRVIVDCEQAKCKPLFNDVQNL